MQICNCSNFTLNSTLLDCIDENSASYAIQLVGAMADNTLQLWSNHEINNPKGIDVAWALFHYVMTLVYTKTKRHSVTLVEQ